MTEIVWKPREPTKKVTEAGVYAAFECPNMELMYRNVMS